ncbi:hypothetical protein BgiMline_015160, partial [Biomphalaria glabrata]
MANRKTEPQIGLVGNSFFMPDHVKRTARHTFQEEQRVGVQSTESSVCDSQCREARNESTISSTTDKGKQDGILNERYRIKRKPQAAAECPDANKGPTQTPVEASDARATTAK